MQAMKPKGRVVAYHCSCCGSPCDPDKKICEYCSENLVTRYRHNRSNFWLKIGNQYIVDLMSFPNINMNAGMVDARCLESEVNSYIRGMSNYDPVISVSIPLTDHIAKQIDFGLRDGVKRIGFETGFYRGASCFEIDGHIAGDTISPPSIETNAIATIKLNIIPDEYHGIVRYDMPEDATCPNCGAVLESRYGCCEYCGGWSEWRVGGG